MTRSCATSSSDRRQRRRWRGSRRFPVTHAQGPDWGVGNSKLQTLSWGTPEWAHRTQVMAEGARDNGIALDMTIGPLWPASTPELDTINDPRGMQQLVFA